jgi:hypothetical protein
MCIITWVAYLLLNNTVWDYYLTHTRIAYIFLYVISGISLYQRRNKNFFLKIGVYMYLLFLLSILTGSVFRMYISYTLDLNDYGVYDKILGKKLVIDTIYKDAKGKPFSVFIFMPGIYTHPYEYLFKTYGKNTHGFVPTEVKNGLAYLIIEPDTSKPWRQKGWLETVVQGGESIWKQTLLNGLILEKRMY